ncbi:hypothetical protein [Bacillus sp. EB01]|uniref:hypothetical protein n=1 Tax=Bacillus sp. EB01 TaxID=1347086 RepID=UPI0005C64B14|nr:hypothetical protein [Bacillus sp. EB01]
MAGKSLAQGLMASSGEQLRLIYVLVMETGIFQMIANKTKDLFEKNIDHSQQKLDIEIAKLKNVDDNKLRLELFLHMTKEFELSGSIYTTSYEIENKCGEILQKAHAYQLKKDKKYLEFATRNNHLQLDSQLSLYQMQQIFQSIGGELNNLTAEQQDNFADQIEKFIESLPIEQQRKIKEKLNIDAVTNSTIKKVIATQGSAVLLAVIVEIAGFAAYTTLTSLLAGTAGLLGLTLPFGVYMTATSVLSVLTGPVGLILVGGASGMMMLAQSKKVKRTLLLMGIVQLMLPILLDDSSVTEYDSFIEEWSKHFSKQNELLGIISVYQKDYTIVSENLAATVKNISVKNNQLMESTRGYNKILNQLAGKLTQVSEHEMTENFKNTNSKITNLELQIRNTKDSIRRNKQKSSFLDKVGGMFSNFSLESDINKLNKQIEELKRNQAIELISIRPSALKNECDEAISYVETEKKIRNELATLNERKRDIEQKRSTVNSFLQQKQDELRKLQKEIYGLGDIV